MPLKTETSRRLARAMEANLPEKLTSAQARWWERNPKFLAIYLGGLADIVIIRSPRKKSGKKSKT